MKKIVLSIVIMSTILLIGTGCSKGKDAAKEDGAKMTGPKLSSKDVVGQEDTTVEGQEMTEYEFKDGTKVALPRGMDIDAADIQLPTEEEAKKYGREEIKKDDDKPAQESETNK